MKGKKVLGIGLVVLAVFLLVACGKDAKKKSSESGSEATDLEAE